MTLISHVYISFYWQCNLVKLVWYIISPMRLVITCKRPRTKIPNRFPTVLKCSSGSQLRKTVKYNLNIRQFSPDMVFENWLAFPIHLIFWYEIFLKHYLQHCRIKKKYSTRLWGVIFNNLALNLQGPLNRLFAWSCTIGESDLMLCTDNRQDYEKSFLMLRKCTDWP